MAQVDNKRPPKFITGQRVVVHPAAGGSKTPRDAAIEPFAGKTATVQDYYYIYSPDRRQIFYVYTVRLASGDERELVAHEDELRSVIE